MDKEKMKDDKYDMFQFKDLDTGLIHSVVAKNPGLAVSFLNRKLDKKVNYTFIGRGRYQ